MKNKLLVIIRIMCVLCVFTAGCSVGEQKLSKKNLEYDDEGEPFVENANDKDFSELTTPGSMEVARTLKYTLSSDLKEVTYDGVIFDDPTKEFWNLECSDTFKIGDKYYITYSAQDDVNITAGSRYYYEEYFNCYESFMLTGKFTYSGNGSFGLAFDYNGDSDNYKMISIDTRTQLLDLNFNEGTTDITSTSVSLKEGETYSFTYIQEGSVGVFYIDGQASLTVRLYGVSGKSIRLFAEDCTVDYTDLREYTR